MCVLGNYYNMYAIAFDFVSRLWYTTAHVDNSDCIIASTLDSRHRFMIIITRYGSVKDVALDPMNG